MDPFVVAVLALGLLLAARRRGGGSGATTAGGGASTASGAAAAPRASSAALSNLSSRMAGVLGAAADRGVTEAGPWGGGQRPLSGYVRGTWRPAGDSSADDASWLPAGARDVEVPWGPYAAGAAREPRDRGRDTPFTVGELGGYVIADGDGTVWLGLSVLELQANEFLAEAMRREHAATGRTEAVSRALWAGNVPRLVRIGGVWDYQGPDRGELDAGRFNLDPLPAVIAVRDAIAAAKSSA